MGWWTRARVAFHSESVMIVRGCRTALDSFASSLNERLEAGERQICCAKWLHGSLNALPLAAD
jgi:hypothetical protein